MRLTARLRPRRARCCRDPGRGKRGANVDSIRREGDRQSHRVDRLLLAERYAGRWESSPRSRPAVASGGRRSESGDRPARQERAEFGELGQRGVGHKGGSLWTAGGLVAGAGCPRAARSRPIPPRHRLLRPRGRRASTVVSRSAACGRSRCAGRTTGGRTRADGLGRCEDDGRAER